MRPAMYLVTAGTVYVWALDDEPAPAASTVEGGMREDRRPANRQVLGSYPAGPDAAARLGLSWT